MNYSSTQQLHLKALESLQKVKSKSSTPTVSATSSRPSTMPKQSSAKPSRPKAPTKSISIQHMSEVKPKNQNQLLYHVLSYLKEVDREVSVEELSMDVAGYDFKNPEIAQELQSSAKIQYEDGKYSFKPIYAVRNINEVLELVNKTPTGIELEQLKESYKTLMEDVKKLEEQKEVIFIKHDESPPNNPRYLVFPNYAAYRISVSEEFSKLWKSIKPPHAVEVEKALNDAGINTTKEEVKQLKRPLTKKKEARKKKVIKVTNAHLTLDVTQAYVAPPKQPP